MPGPADECRSPRGYHSVRSSEIGLGGEVGIVVEVDAEVEMVEAEVGMVETGVEMVEAEVGVVETGVEMVEVVGRLPSLPPNSLLLPPCRAYVTTSAASFLCFDGLASR